MVDNPKSYIILDSDDSIISLEPIRVYNMYNVDKALFRFFNKLHGKNNYYISKREVSDFINGRCNLNVSIRKKIAEQHYTFYIVETD